MLVTTTNAVPRGEVLPLGNLHRPSKLELRDRAADSWRIYEWLD